MTIENSLTTLVEENRVNSQHGAPIEISSEIENLIKWTNVQVDSQVMSLFMSCPAKYNYVFNRHLQPVDGVSVSIARGSVVHDGLLAYWKERIKSDNYQEATKLCIAKIQEGLNKNIKFSADFKLETLQGTLEYLKYVAGQLWIPLEAEKYFRLKIYEDENLKLRIYLTGRIDLIVRMPQIPIFPIDVKTETERWFHSVMGNQFKIYNLACGTNLLGVQRVGFQTSLEAKDKFKLETLAFDPDILEEYRTVTLPYWVKQMLIAHEDNHFPMNVTSCISGHFACNFSDKYNGGICSVSRAVREQKIGRYFVVGPEWDPSKTD
jgi:hypothetical protein